MNYNWIAETKRFKLREFHELDANDLFMLNADPEVLKYTGDEAFVDEADAKQFIHAYNHYKQFGFGRWAVINKVDLAFVGWCGLKYSPDKDEVDVGFRLHRMHWNKGIATETAAKALQLGFETFQLETIVGNVAKKNTASIQVIEKLGFTSPITRNLSKHDGWCYHMHRDDWKRINKLQKDK